jgi:hypothetical protein
MKDKWPLKTVNRRVNDFVVNVKDKISSSLIYTYTYLHKSCHLAT